MLNLLLILNYCLAPRATLIAENLALRQQVEVLKRHAPRLELRRRDRLFWVILRRLWSGWHSSLVLVSPETGVARMDGLIYAVIAEVISLHGTVAARLTSG